jgi:hypothetical protein
MNAIECVKVLFVLVVFVVGVFAATYWTRKIQNYMSRQHALRFNNAAREARKAEKARKRGFLQLGIYFLNTIFFSHNGLMANTPSRTARSMRRPARGFSIPQNVKIIASKTISKMLSGDSAGKGTLMSMVLSTTEPSGEAH